MVVVLFVVTVSGWVPWKRQAVTMLLNYQHVKTILALPDPPSTAIEDISVIL
jgi:hypothetical protein